MQVLIILNVKLFMKRGTKDRSVGVVIGALLLTVIMFSLLSAYILYYVPTAAQENAISSVTSQENGYISLSQGMYSPGYPGYSLSQSMPLGYGGIPPFSQPTSTSISYTSNSSIFSASLNYSFNITLTNSTLPKTLSANEVAVLPITIRSAYNEPATFNLNLLVKTSKYKSLEAPHLTNILFQYTNGTVIPSWLEDNNTNTSVASNYWLKLNSITANNPLTIYMVFLPLYINVMNKYQTGEAAQLSPIFGQYNDIAQVFNQGLEYQIYYSSSSNVDSTLYQTNLYLGSLSNGASIQYSRYTFTSSTAPFLTNFTGNTQTVCTLQATPTSEPNVIMNYNYGYSNGEPYPNPPVANPSGASWLIKMIGFAQVNTTTQINASYAMGVGIGWSVCSGPSNGVNWLGLGSNSNNIVNDYNQCFTGNKHNNQEPYLRSANGTIFSGSYAIEMDYFGDHGKEYTSMSSNNMLTYYSPAFPTNGAIPAVTYGSVSIDNITTIPVTVTNTQSTPEPANFQQNVSFNSSEYMKYEDQGLQNLLFVYSNGSIVPSWLESGDNRSVNSVFWLSLNSLPAFGSVDINIVLLPRFMNVMNTFRTGESPNLSAVYAEYDDGVHVFPFYNNGCSASGMTSTSSSSLLSTSNVSGPNGSVVKVITLSGSVGSSSAETVAWFNTPTGGNIILQGWMNINTNNNALFAARGGNLTANTNYLLGLGWYGKESSIALENGSSNSLIAGSSSGLPSPQWFWVSSVISGSNLSSNVYNYPASLGGTLSATASTTNTTLPSTNNYSGIAVWSGSSGSAYFYLLRAIEYPANGTFPTVQVGLNESSTAVNPNILEYSGSVVLKGTITTHLNVGSNGGTDLYLSDGSAILSNGKMQVISSILPVNVTLNGTDLNLGVNAVSLSGKNVTAAGQGSSIIKLLNTHLLSDIFYKNETISLLSPAFVPYTAQIAKINLTSFKYTISGVTANGFNYSMYQKFGNSQLIGSNSTWFMGSNSFSVHYASDTLTIQLVKNYVYLNALDLNYFTYSLLDI